MTLAVTALVLGGAQDAQKPPAVPVPDPMLVPLNEYFHGKITRVEAAAPSKDRPAATTIEIAYDFSSAEQLRDFDASLPFRAVRTIEYAIRDGRVEIKGTGSMRHRAVFSDELSAHASITPRRPRDIGLAVTEARESEVFTLYCMYDKHFSAGDGVFTPQNMIIKFIPRDPKVNKDGLQDWRYCGSRGPAPVVQAGVTYAVAMTRSANESEFTITTVGGDRFHAAGTEWDRDLTSMMFGVYAHDSHLECDDLVIRGRLDAEYIKRERLDVTRWKLPSPATATAPTAPAATTGAADRAALRARGVIDGYPLETTPLALAALLRDAGTPPHLRAEAAEKAKSVGLKRIVPFLVDGLYSADLDARKLSFDVMKTLVGKSFNFRADGPEDGRKKSIRDLNEYLQKHPEEFL